MAYKLSVVEPSLGLNFNVKYHNLAKKEKPSITAKAPDGTVVKERMTFNGQLLGQTQRQWCDDNGNVYPKAALKFYDEDGLERKENSMSKTFTIEGFSPLKNYTDLYVIDTFYEVFPSDNDLKKDFDKEIARITNLHGMKKLWQHLMDNEVVARGEFYASSKGFRESYGYIRAIEFGNKWGLEIGVFKEEKIFEFLQEEVPSIPAAVAAPARKLKLV